MVYELKPSGIDFAAQIPKDWTTCRLKYLTKIETGNKDTINAVEDGEYPFFIRSPKVQSIDTFSLDCEAVLTAGDGDVGKIFHYINGKFDFHQRVYCFHNFSLNLNGKFFYYYIKENFIHEIDKGTNKTTVESLRLPMIKNFELCIPPINEQIAIANFLDEKCKKISAMLSEMGQQVDALQRHRRALIVDRITNGINQCVEVKSSENRFYPTLPAHWQIKRLKYVFKIKKNIAGKEGYDVLAITQKGIKIKDITNNAGQLADDYSNYQLVSIGDFAMNHMDLLTGWVDISPFSGVTSPDYRVFNFINNQNFCSEYYLYFMQMCYTECIFYQLGQGVSTLGRWRLTADQFYNLTIPVPPLDEQKQIAEYLKEKCNKIDALIGEKLQAIEVMQNYGKTLIYEYVTGKKRVEEVS